MKRKVLFREVEYLIAYARRLKKKIIKVGRRRIQVFVTGLRNTGDFVTGGMDAADHWRDLRTA